MVTQKPQAERQTVNLPDAFKMLGISRPVGYELARRDALPVPVIRFGHRMVISKRAIEDLLNARKTNGDTAPHSESRPDGQSGG